MNNDGLARYSIAEHKAVPPKAHYGLTLSATDIRCAFRKIEQTIDRVKKL